MTKRQREVLDFVVAYIERERISPSLAEIGAGVGCGQVTAHMHVSALVKQGRLRRTKNATRSLEVITGGVRPGECENCRSLRLELSRALEALNQMRGKISVADARGNGLL